MKILNWVRRKFSQNLLHEPGQQHKYGCCSSVLCRGDLSCHELKGLSTVTKLAEARRLNETEIHYTRNGILNPPNVAKLEIDNAFSDVHSGLRRITDSDIGSDPKNDCIDVTKQNGCALDDTELGLLELAELQEELQKIFCSQNENGRSEAQSWKLETKLVENSHKKSMDTHSSEKKHHENAGDKKAPADTRLYPLKEFLETPLQQPIVKRNKLLRSLSSLLNRSRLLESQHNISDTQSVKLSKTIHNAKYSERSKDVWAMLTARGTRIIGLPDRNLHGSGLRQLVQVFQKKRCRPASSSSTQKAPTEKLDVIEGTLYVPAGRILSKNGVTSTPASSISDFEQNPHNELESFTFHEDPNDWTLPNQGWLPASSRNNEYWINTDDEYVVLEL